MARIPHPRIGDPNGECAFQRTTYRESDFAHQSAEFSLSLFPPPTVPGVGGAPESARLLDCGPETWIRSLSRAQSVDAARKLHRDMVLILSYLNILDQYVSPSPGDCDENP